MSKSLVVHAEQITCAIPHFARFIGYEYFGGAFGVVEIPRHDVIAVYPQFANAIATAAIGSCFWITVGDFLACFGDDFYFL